MTLAFFLTHWFHYFYVPPGEPWYHGNVWGNLFVVLIAAPLGWLWSRTRFWPLLPIRHGIAHLHEKFDRHHTLLQELHEKHDRLGASLADLHEKHDQLLHHVIHNGGQAEPETEPPHTG